MAREILSAFGPDASKSQAKRATTGGIKKARDVNAYQKPCGPTSISNRGPGLGGKVRVSGSQGMHSAPTGEVGGPGLGGETRKVQR